jgi:hypothetical protein
MPGTELNSEKLSSTRTAAVSRGKESPWRDATGGAERAADQKMILLFMFDRVI